LEKGWSGFQQDHGEEKKKAGDESGGGAKKAKEKGGVGEDRIGRENGEESQERDKGLRKRWNFDRKPA